MGRPAALSHADQRRLAKLLVAGAMKAAQLVGFLKILCRQSHQNLLAIWDGLSGHRSRLVCEHIASTGGTLVIDFLPAYAPELNPVEHIWAHLKQHEIANLCVDHQRSRCRTQQPQIHAAPPRPDSRILETRATGKLMSCIYVKLISPERKVGCKFFRSLVFKSHAVLLHFEKIHEKHHAYFFDFFRLFCGLKVRYRAG
ncbi:MAG: hypothetical protein HHJ12_05750 [Glaciimonas sp.]|nr:hypothetical protein [Glaciimonas sp.]